MPVMGSDEQRDFVGGSTIDANGVIWYSQAEMNGLQSCGSWNGGFVDGMGYVGGVVTVSASSEYCYNIGVVSGGVTIDNRDDFTKSMALNDPTTLAITALNKYQQQYGVPLNISVESLTAEIYWHAYLYDHGISTDHTNVANCGEDDSDRAKWNAISWGSSYSGSY